MTAAKHNLPAHGYLGYYRGHTKTEVKEIIRKKFVVPTGSKIIVNDHDVGKRGSNTLNVYEVEVLAPKIRKTLKKTGRS